MEKRTPHCRLVVVKNLLAAGKVRATVSALAGGAALGFGFEEISRRSRRATSTKA
jgi:motility quorum-sensing regulator/GCU-specific mRNA interferase toxin